MKHVNQSFDSETGACEIYERHAEKLLPLIDQKYENYFKWSTNDPAKDNVFKDIYNLNHQIISLLRNAENKANAEYMRANRNKRIIKEMEVFLCKEGKSYIF